MAERIVAAEDAGREATAARVSRMRAGAVGGTDRTTAKNSAATLAARRAETYVGRVIVLQGYGTARIHLTMRAAPVVESPSPGDASGEPAWEHVPGLDGVRGVAVIAVLLFHGGVSWAKGGFLGVDAFFVLSGLLITSLLLDEAARTDRVNLGRFWARRARRLLPALLLVLVATGVYAKTLAPRATLAGLRRDGLATLLYVANWRYIQAGANYFEATSAPSILRHTWSLAIEEQFYLVWPLVMFGIVRVARITTRRLAGTAAIAGLGVAASATAMWAVFHPGQDPSRAYYGTDSRVQVVLTGALLAAVIAIVRRQPGDLGRGAARALGVAAAIGSGAFLAAVATLHGTETLLFRGGFVGVSLAVAALLAHIVLVPRGWSAYVMSWAPLRAVGVVSYGLYLWHWPVFLTLTHDRTGLAGVALLIAKLVVSAGLAIASYFLVELPIRRGALPKMQSVVALALAMSLTAAAITVGTEPPPLKRLAAGAVARTASGFPVSPRAPRPVGQPARVLVVGDSIAKTLAQRLEGPARGAGLNMVNKGELGCGIARGGPYRYFGKQLNPPGICDHWPRQWAEHIGRFDPDVVLAVIGRWEVMDRVHDGRWTHLGDPVFDRYLTDELERAVEVLSVGDAIVAFTTAPYFLRGERPDGGRWPEDDPARVDRFNALLRAVAARHPERVAILDLNERTSRNGQYTPVIDGTALRTDGVHFSAAGAAYLRLWLFGALTEMAPTVKAGARPTATTAPPDTTPRGRPHPAPAPRRRQPSSAPRRRPPRRLRHRRPPPRTRPRQPRRSRPSQSASDGLALANRCGPSVDFAVAAGPVGLAQVLLEDLS